MEELTFFPVNRQLSGNPPVNRPPDPLRTFGACRVFHSRFRRSDDSAGSALGGPTPRNHALGVCGHRARSLCQRCHLLLLDGTVSGQQTLPDDFLLSPSSSPTTGANTTVLQTLRNSHPFFRAIHPVRGTQRPLFFRGTVQDERPKIHDYRFFRLSPQRPSLLHPLLPNRQIGHGVSGHGKNDPVGHCQRRRYRFSSEKISL